MTEGVELHRYAVWKANKKYVDEHNSKPGFRLEMNKFADLVRNIVIRLHVHVHALLHCSWVMQYTTYTISRYLGGKEEEEHSLHICMSPIT